MHERSLNTVRRPDRTFHKHFRLFAQRVNDSLRTLRSTIKRMGAKVREVETILDPLVDHVASTERELQELQERVTRLERRRPR